MYLELNHLLNSLWKKDMVALFYNVIIFLIFVSEIDTYKAEARSDTCTGQPWVKVDIDTKRYKGEYEESDYLRSFTGCAEKCNHDDKCNSFGVDKRSFSCLLYTYHVWSGGEIIDADRSYYYYWKLQKTCPSHYQYKTELNFCFKYFNTRANWTTAMVQCNKDGGLLAMLQTEEKYNFIQEFVKASGTVSQVIYVGATDVQDEGSWKWFNGEAITKWYSPGQPDNYYNMENCGSIGRFGLNDVPCNYNFAYVCEIPTIGLNRNISV